MLTESADDEGAAMSRVLITGSSDGLGLLAAKLLIEQGHEVVVHGRNPDRSGDALAASGAERAVTGELSTVAGAESVADEANKLGPFDAIIHNAGIGYRQTHRVEASPGIPNIFAVNVLAPYILTALIGRPKRLIYVASGMHRGVNPRIDDLLWTKRTWNGAAAYAESKLYDVMLAFAVGRRWEQTPSNALEPGWVPTKMGGPSAPDDLMEGCVTQVWLATSGSALTNDSGLRVDMRSWTDEEGHRGPA
jgi:NAD(P)-dependent dehydrogenase (short-subunit alcohol dehydrogenase family)